MAKQAKEDAGKKDPKKKKGKKGASKFLVLGKIFLLLAILAGQALLAYALVDRYYPDFYASLHAKSPDDFGVYQLEELVVNPANTNGKRFLLVEISLELDDQEHIPLIENKTMRLKQEMIESLSSRTVQELTAVEGREELRAELSNIINSSIGVRSVRNLYFTKYVMQ